MYCHLVPGVTVPPSIIEAEDKCMLHASPVNVHISMFRLVSIFTLLNTLASHVS